MKCKELFFSKLYIYINLDKLVLDIYFDVLVRVLLHANLQRILFKFLSAEVKYVYDIYTWPN